MNLIEAAKALGLHVATVSTLIRNKKLNRSGERVRDKRGFPAPEVTQADIEEFLKKYERVNGKYVLRMELPNGFREVPRRIEESKNPARKSCIDVHEVLTWVVETAPLNTPVGKALEIRDKIVKMFEEL